MNNTFVPTQTLVVEVAIATSGSIALLTVTVMLLLEAVDGVAQADELVMFTFTTLLFAKLEEIKVGLFVPALVPLTCH